MGWYKDSSQSEITLRILCISSSETHPSTKEQWEQQREQLPKRERQPPSARCQREWISFCVQRWRLRGEQDVRPWLQRPQGCLEQARVLFHRRREQRGECIRGRELCLRKLGQRGVRIRGRGQREAQPLGRQGQLASQWLGHGIPNDQQCIVWFGRHHWHQHSGILR